MLFMREALFCDASIFAKNHFIRKRKKKKTGLFFVQQVGKLCEFIGDTVFLSMVSVEKHDSLFPDSFSLKILQLH